MPLSLKQLNALRKLLGSSERKTTKEGVATKLAQQMSWAVRTLTRSAFQRRRAQFIAAHQNCSSTQPRPETEFSFNGHALSLLAAYFLQELRELHHSACEKHPSIFDEFLLTESPQTKSCSLPVRKIYLNTLSRFSIKVADEKVILTARDKARAQLAMRAVAKRFASGEEQAIPAAVAERSPSASTTEESRRLRVRNSTKCGRLRFGLASTSSSQKKRRSSLLYGHKILLPVL